MHGRDGHGVRRGVADVGVRIRVVAGRLVLEPLGEPLVLRLRVRGEVDLLVVRDHLAELAELVEDELAAARVPGQRVLAHVERLEEVQVEPLDVVDRVPLVARRSRGRSPAPPTPLPSRRPDGISAAASQSAFSDAASMSLTMNRKMPTTAWISGLSKSRFRPLTTNGMPRRRSSATSGSESFATDRNKHGAVGPRQAARLRVGAVTERHAAQVLDAVDDPGRLRVRVVERQGEQVAALPLLVARRDHRLRRAARRRGYARRRSGRASTTPRLDRKLSSRVTCRTPA